MQFKMLQEKQAVELGASVKLGKHVEQIPLNEQVWQLGTEHVTH
jgi:hypothetical protein